MAARAAQRRISSTTILLFRSKTTSAQHVAARQLDPTFDKLMDGYKNLSKVTAVRDLILASPARSLSLPLLSTTAQRLHLNPSAAHFIRTYSHIFTLRPDPTAPATPLIRLSPAAASLSLQESSASSSPSAAAHRLSRLLSLSPSRSLPLRAVFKVWRDLALPDDFERSVLSSHPSTFSLSSNPKEPNTHILHLHNPNPNFTAAVDEWRERQGGGEEVRYGFKQGFPPGMRLSKDFRARMKEWQRMPYAGPYEVYEAKGRSKKAARAAEKRAVGIAHEFLNLTVERMVEVERFSQFRKWFGIELNVRDMFVDHPGIFYLSTKGKTHTVFLREAYDRGRLIESNPVYEARMQLLDLVLLRRRGVVHSAGMAAGAEMVDYEDEEDKEKRGSCF